MITLVYVALMLPNGAIAHNLQVREDVAVTFHLEPNHNPKVNRPAQTWFLLTQAGGKIIPFSQCHCQLQVVALQPKTVKSFIPPLQAVTAERYRGIPGATFKFPQVGLYELQLTGKPKNGGSFQPFRVSYKVTVTG
ncbi:MAG: hypothetical protein SFT94_09215 [Pseudanabaenaceae cyanobacterium bins.68]|nr:hypothetical protein [Pseudanabaenaceae cyanobacterium bins.68]